MKTATQLASSHVRSDSHEGWQAEVCVCWQNNCHVYSSLFLGLSPPFDLNWTLGFSCFQEAQTQQQRREAARALGCHLKKNKKGLRYTCVTQRYQRGDRGKQTCTSCPVSSMTLHWNNVKSELLASKRKQKISKNGYSAVKSQHCLFTASCWTTPDTVQALIILYHCVLYWNILYCLLNKNPITDGGTKVIPWLFKHVFFNQKVVKDIFSYEYGVHRAFSFFIMIPTAFFSQTLWVNVGAG